MSIDDYIRVYGFTQSIAHLLLRNQSTFQSALCGANPPLESWLGTDDHFQVDKAKNLQLCTDCKGLANGN